MKQTFRSQFKRLWDEIKWALLGILWLLSLSLGYWGFTVYAQHNSLPYTILDRIYLSLQLISMNSGAVEGQVNWMLELARFLVPALTAFTAFQAIINLFREQTQWWHLWRLREHIIVCGLGRKGSYLVDDLLAHGLQLVAIEKNLEPATAQEYQRKGVVVIEGDAADPDTLERARLPRASQLICLLGDDQQNLSIALQAHQLLKGTQRKPLTCIVHLVSEELLNLVKKSELNSNTDVPFNLEIFNTYQRTAHTLVEQVSEKHPGPNQILIIGMGRLGTNIIEQTAYQRYIQNPNDKLQFTVMDREAQAKVDKLINEYPHLSSVCDFTPIQMDLSISKKLKNSLADQLIDINFERVYVCLGNPILGIQVSLTLMEIPSLSEVPIFIRLEKNSGLFDLLHVPLTVQKDKTLVTPFDMYEQTCSAHLVFGGMHELLAMKLRENYIKSLDPEKAKRLAEIPWDEISEEEKDANRQQASRICQLLHAAGYAISPLVNWDASKMTFDPMDVEKMAKMEHDRWCQLKREAGWQYGTPRDDQQKIHPDLIAWENLPKAERDKNTIIIINLPSLLAELGFQIDKI